MAVVWFINSQRNCNEIEDLQQGQRRQHMLQKEKKSATLTINMLLVYCCTRPPSSFPVLKTLAVDDQMLSILQPADIIDERQESTVFEMTNTQIVCLQLHLKDDPASKGGEAA